MRRSDVWRERDKPHRRKADLKASIADREIARGFHLQKSHIAFYLHSLRDADWSDKETQKRLIQTFVNAVFVYDDHITLTYNFSGDKNIVTLRDMQRFEDGAEFGCRAVRLAPPLKDNPNTLFFIGTLFGQTTKHRVE